MSTTLSSADRAPAIGTAYAIALALIASLGACSRDQPAREQHADAPVTPEIASQDPPRTPQAGSVMDAQLEAGGVAARYEARFSENQLTRIDESRMREGATASGATARGATAPGATAPGATARGAYEFYGARLLKYEGAGLTSDAHVQLELDLQGRTTKALAGDQPASDAEITALRERAQLLRSHALAQRATRSHAGGSSPAPAH